MKFTDINSYLIISILFIVIIYVLIKRLFKSEYNYGEDTVEKILDTLPRSYRVLNDIMIPTKNATTQIDHIVVCKKGVYVIETKALNGVVYGNEYSREWTQVSKDKNIKIHNPIFQNKGHISALKYLCRDYKHIEFIPVLTFADFTKLSVDVENYPIVRFKNLRKFIKKYRSKNLTNKEVKEIYKLIKSANIKNPLEKKRHIQRIENNKKEFEKNINKKICPRCGHKLKKKRIKRNKYLYCNNCNFKDLL